MTVLERIFRNFKFELPSTTIQSFRLTKDVVTDPENSLKQLLAEKHTQPNGNLPDELKEFVTKFKDEHGLELIFEKDAIGRLLELQKTAGISIEALCQ